MNISGTARAPGSPGSEPAPSGQAPSGQVLDFRTRRTIVLVAVFTGAALCIVHRGIGSRWAGFDSPVHLTLLYTLLTAVPAVILLLLAKTGDRTPWIAGASYAVLLSLLALHTGHAVVPEITFGNGGIYFHFGAVVAVVSFTLVPFIQARRETHSAFHYPALFEHAWNNALTLAAAVVTLACWLILALWQGLFGLIGVTFFRELFQLPQFTYPASGLFFGAGMVAGRTQTAAIRTLLNICLILGRMLFPLVAGVALLFLCVLPFNSLAPLWQTRHAAALLLTLVFTVVALLNAIYQDGARANAGSAPLKLLASAALLALPIFVGIAAYALYLRVAERGWTEDRLWACLVTIVAALHALGYAAAVLVRRPTWLALVGPANAYIALGVMFVLLATQSPLLDFRSIAVHSQVDRALGPGGDVAKLDLDYLRFEAGKPGNDALHDLESDPRLAANQELQANIGQVLKANNKFTQSGRLASGIDASTFTVLPDGTSIPAGLLEALKKPLHVNGPMQLDHPCAESHGKCVLLNVALGQDGGMAWVEVDDSAPWQLYVFSQDASGWQFRGTLRSSIANDTHVMDAIKSHQFTTENPPWKDLVIGGSSRYRFEPHE